MRDLPIVLGAQNIHHQDILLANCLAQSQALMQGLNIQEAQENLIQQGTAQAQAEFLAKHKHITGNKPSTTLIIDKITPFNLGQIISLYEHKIYTQSVIWDINAFDQWGVELGKNLSRKLTNAMKGYNSIDSFSSSTIGLVEEINRLKG